MSDNRDAVMKKIEKLLRLSKSTNQHEAELALAKANELMAEYQIESADVELAKAKEEAPLEDEYYTVKDLKMKYRWIVDLAGACAKLYDGDAINILNLHETRIQFVGPKGNIQLMKVTFEYLYESWKSIVENDLRTAKTKFLRDQGYSFQPRDTMKFKLGHGTAFSTAIYWRVDRLVKERKSKLEKYETGKALVVVNEDNLNKWYSENGVKIRKMKQSRGNSVGREYGHAAGSSIPLAGIDFNQNKRLS